MLFDPRPKRRREDLFDRERELKELMDNVDVPLIVVTGVRRVGEVLSP